MKFVTQLIKHNDISEKQITEICNLKEIRWNYSFEQQYQWIINNIKQNDYHILIREGGTAIAYSNLVNITVTINSKSYKAKGVGNVCTRATGKGYGNILMVAVNDLLKKHSWIALLRCKDPLVGYYKKFRWNLVERQVIHSAHEASINYMLFNFDSIVHSFEFNGENF